MIPPVMATPRRNIIDPSSPTICHCISRCVRRLFLLESCGTDPDRWKRMLGDRLAFLVSVFAIDVLEFAILGNHFHLVLATHPDLVALWTDREIAIRWRTLTPDYQWRRRKRIPYHFPAQEYEVEEMLADPKAVAAARRTLANVSSFHKFLKQRVAMLANAEDEVTGHFWEGRFKSIVAADTEAVIAHMVYVALNPVRAGLARTLEECTFSSVGTRIAELKRRIRAGEFAGEAEAARERLRGLKLVPALPCDPGERVRRMQSLPIGLPNPWQGGRVPPIVEGLTLSAYLFEVERAGNAGGGSNRPTVAAKPSVLGRLERELDRAAAAVLMTARSFAAPLAEAMARRRTCAVGNFSGKLASVAKRAAELGRQAVWTVFDPEGIAHRCRVAATPSG